MLVQCAFSRHCGFPCRAWERASRLRGAPMSSRCSYWTGESAPITGERGSFSGFVWRTSGYSERAARLPPSMFRSTAPAGLACATGASRPRRASVSVPRV